MEDGVVSQVQPGQIDKGMGFGEKFINIFLNPHKTIMALDNKPTWLVPLLLIILAGLIASQVTLPIESQMALKMIRNMPNISADQMKVIEEQLSGNLTLARIRGLVTSIIGIPLVFLIISGIVFFVGSIVLGGSTSFKKVFSVFTWSGLIYMLSLIVVTPLILYKQSLFVSISPALLLPGDAVGSTLFIFLSQLSFFIIWQVVVFAYGFACIYKFSLTKAFISIGVLWAIWVVIITIFASTFSKFMM